MPLISLVGLPGSGKSTIGRRLGVMLGWRAVDTDLEIESRLGCSIATCFERSGEEAFRDLEEQVLDMATQELDAVISTGGGAVLRQANRAALKQRSTVVYLDAPLPDLARRLARDRHRPLLDAPGALDTTLRRLFDARDPLYRETAHVVVSMAGLTASGAALAVRAALDASSRWPRASNGPWPTSVST